MSNPFNVINCMCRDIVKMCCKKNLFAACFAFIGI